MCGRLGGRFPSLAEDCVPLALPECDFRGALLDRERVEDCSLSDAPVVPLFWNVSYK